MCKGAKGRKKGRVYAAMVGKGKGAAIKGGAVRAKSKAQKSGVSPAAGRGRNAMCRNRSVLVRGWDMLGKVLVVKVTWTGTAGEWSGRHS